MYDADDIGGGGYGTDPGTDSAVRGAGGPVEIDWSDLLPPDPGTSARRRPIVRISFRDVEKLAAYMVRCHDEAAEPLYREWYANRQMRHEADAPQPRTSRDPPHRKAYRPDIVGPIIRQRNALATATPFVVKVRPATVEPQDAHAAEQADAVIRYQDRENPPERLREQMLEFAVDCSGLAFVQVAFDPRGGRLLGYDASSGQQVPVHEGLARRTVVPPWEMLWDPAATGDSRDGLGSCAWMGRRQRMTRADLARVLTPEELALVFDARGDEREAPGDQESSYLWMLDDPSGNRDGRSNRSSRQYGGRPYTLVELHLRRCDEWPHGLYIRTVNAKVVSVHVAPYADLDPEGLLDIPYVVYRDWLYAGRFAGIALSSKLRQLQEAANDANTSARERDRIAAYLKILATHVEAFEKVWNTEHGQFIGLPPGANVTVFEPKPSGPEHFVTVDRAERAAERIANVNQPTRGTSETEKTAFEVSVLRDADQIAISSVVGRLNAAHEAIVRKELVLVRHLYALPRQLRIAGATAGVAARAFVGSDITGNEDVAIYSDRFIPPGPAAAREAVDYLTSLQQQLDPMGLSATPLMTIDRAQTILGYRAGLFDAIDRVEQIARAEAETLLTTGAMPLLTSVHEDWQTRYRVYREYLTHYLYATSPARPLFDVLIDAVFQKAQAQRARDSGAALLMAGADPNVAPDAQRPGDSPRPRPSAKPTTSARQPPQPAAPPRRMAA